MEKSNNENFEKFEITTCNLSFIYESVYKAVSKSNPELKVEPKNNVDSQCTDSILTPDTKEALKTLRNINLNIEKGKFILLCGNTGSGKSTLVRCFNGLIPHFYSGLFYGYVNVKGKDSVDTPISELSTHVGLVFQNPENQLVSMTVERELAFGLENRGIPVDEIREKIDYIMDYLEIKHLKDRHPYELSGGEQQRVAIGSILVLEPDVIILDEPTSTLDPKSVHDVIKLLRKINIEKQKTMIVIEHRLDTVLEYLDQIIVMEKGTVLANKPVLEILNQETLRQTNIEIPQYIELLYSLRNQGFSIDLIPNDIIKSASIIERIIEEKLKIK
jgi:energy-coupling factor transporter ATP-binding protein EcfA2